MKKLSNAAELFLTEFYALKIAEDEVNTFLDNIRKRVCKLTEEKLNSTRSEHYEWDINIQRDGRLEIIPMFNKSMGVFQKDKKMISVLYRDVRDYKNLNDTKSIRISIFCRKNLKDNLHSFPDKDLILALNEARRKGVQIDLESSIPALFSEIIEIDTTDMEKSSLKVAEETIRVQKGLEAFINSLISHLTCNCSK